MPAPSECIHSLTEEARDFIISSRRALHAIPETAFTEHKTSAYIAETLHTLGYSPVTGIAGTGITATLRFAGPGPCLMIRADMDALLVKEETGLPFASCHEGRMHACGHDGHMAMVLGAARVLSKLASGEEGKRLGGSVMFLFQPAEEAMGGAQPMIDSGVLEGVDRCLATHIWPALAEGCVGLREGPLMAAMDRFEIHLKGTGGHGAQPHLGTDALDAAAQLGCALQHIVSRRVNPLLPAVLSITCLRAGETYNVIPETALLMGSARAFHPEVRDAWAGHIEAVAEGITRGTGVSHELRFLRGHGPVLNDAEMTARMQLAAVRAVGSTNVVVPDMTMAGEDFSVYQEHLPGCLFFLGAGREDSLPLHNPGFHFNEEILVAGTRVFCEAAMEYLWLEPG